MLPLAYGKDARVEQPAAVMAKTLWSVSGEGLATDGDDNEDDDGDA